MKNFFKKGQISLFVAIIGAVGMIGASITTGWFSASSRVFGVEKRVSIVEEREQNHFSELSKAIEKIDKKLDKLIDAKLK